MKKDEKGSFTTPIGRGATPAAGTAGRARGLAPKSPVTGLAGKDRLTAPATLHNRVGTLEVRQVMTAERKRRATVTEANGYKGAGRRG